MMRLFGSILLLCAMASSLSAETRTLYSWKSDNGVVTQTGGTIVQHGSVVNRINVECSGYYVIALLGKRENINDGTSAVAATYMELTLADGETFHAGDRSPLPPCVTPRRPLPMPLCICFMVTGRKSLITTCGAISVFLRRHP